MVNGKVVTDLAFDVSEKDKVLVDNNRVTLPAKFTYLMLHKLKGFLSTVSDDRGRKTVMDLLPEELRFVKPIGRLDYNSEGLLLFTNDGDLAQKLMRPNYAIPKTYIVRVEGEVTEENIKAMEQGVTLIDGTTYRGCEIKLLEIFERKTKMAITLFEGKNREIRKMLGHFGYNVIFLKRIAIGDIQLGGLPRGKFRFLVPSEIEYLKNL